MIAAASAQNLRPASIRSDRSLGPTRHLRPGPIDHTKIMDGFDPFDPCRVWPHPWNSPTPVGTLSTAPRRFFDDANFDGKIRGAGTSIDNQGIDHHYPVDRSRHRPPGSDRTGAGLPALPQCCPQCSDFRGGATTPSDRQIDRQADGPRSPAPRRVPRTGCRIDRSPRYHPGDPLPALP